MMQRNTKKMVMCIAICTLMTALLSGCGKEKESVTLSLWGPEEDQEMLGEMVMPLKKNIKRRQNLINMRLKKR